MKQSDQSQFVIDELKQFKSSNVSLADAIRKIDMVIAMGEKMDVIESKQNRIDNDFWQILERLDIAATEQTLATLMRTKMQEYDERFAMYLDNFKKTITDQISRKTDVEKFEKSLEDVINQPTFNIQTNRLRELENRVDGHIGRMEGFQVLTKNELNSKVNKISMKKHLDEKADKSQVEGQIVLLNNKIAQLEKTVNEFQSSSDESSSSSNYSDDEMSDDLFESTDDAILDRKSVFVTDAIEQANQLMSHLVKKQLPNTSNDNTAKPDIYINHQKTTSLGPPRQARKGIRSMRRSSLQKSNIRNRPQQDRNAAIELLSANAPEESDMAASATPRAWTQQLDTTEQAIFSTMDATSFSTIPRQTPTPPPMTGVPRSRPGRKLTTPPVSSLAIPVGGKRPRKSEKPFCSQYKKYGGKISKSAQYAINDLYRMIQNTNKLQFQGQKDYSQLRNEFMQLSPYLESLNMAMGDIGSQLREVHEQSLALVNDRHKLVEEQAKVQEIAEGVHQKMSRVQKKFHTIKTKHDESSRIKRILILEANVDKVMADTRLLKEKHSSRFNELLNIVRQLSDSKNRLQRDVSRVGSHVQQVEQDTRADYSELIQDIDSIKGPMISYMSDNQRENKALEEEVSRQNEFFRSFQSSQDASSSFDYTQQMYSTFMDSKRLSAKSRALRNRGKSMSPGSRLSQGNSCLTQPSYVRLSQETNEENGKTVVTLPRFKTVMEESSQPLPRPRSSMQTGLQRSAKKR